ncbi:unnamed protein product [Leptidea sinapis]|uniref:RRM domain-containing protein n=1 Tax=Leptidea sinapis TaxID=189913 RepID=A0A5E4QSI0_9NEOP|nr:unnamed protein product [Leptidea sinapis]
MVRETRHLWVGNLPDNVREDKIREHFKRYGRVQSIKLLGRMENATTGAGGNINSGVCATVAFMDIKSASKAHNIEHVLDERTLTTEYYEPAAIPSAAGAPSAGSSPAGSGYSGSSSSVNSTSATASASRLQLSLKSKKVIEFCDQSKVQDFLWFSIIFVIIFLAFCIKFSIDQIVMCFFFLIKLIKRILLKKCIILLRFSLFKPYYVNKEFRKTLCVYQANHVWLKKQS